MNKCRPTFLSLTFLLHATLEAPSTALPSLPTTNITSHQQIILLEHKYSSTTHSHQDNDIDNMGSSSKWTVEKFHCEQILREEFGVEIIGDGVQIAYDMMGRLFGEAYCTPARKTNGNKYSAQRFQDRKSQSLRVSFFKRY